MISGEVKMICFLKVCGYYFNLYVKLHRDVLNRILH